MRNLKKVLSLVLAMVMVLSMMVTANAAFADADDINANYAEAVEVMNAIGILKGSNGNFNPKGTLSRAEAAVILSKAHSGVSVEAWFKNETKYTENPFADVDGWETPYVLYCYQNDIVGGQSATKYGVDDNLTGYEFAKMLLVAAGYGKHADYVGDANQTWKQKVMLKAKDAGLLDGLTITLNNDITREQASQMALNAMMAGGKSTTTYYVVTTAVAGVTAANTAPATYVNKSADAMDAYFMKTILGADYEVLTVTKTTGGLLADNFGVSYTYNSEDTFGRPAAEYVIPAAITGTVAQSMYYPKTALAVYTAPTLPTTIAADLAGYKTGAYSVSWDTVAIPVTYTYSCTVDGVNDPAVSTSYNFATELYLLTDANQTVYVYGNASTRQITEVVIVKNYVDEIDSVTDAVAQTNTPSYATISAGTFVNLAGYKKGDVVSYNVDENGVTNVAPATGAFEGVLSNYTSNGKYTVNGDVYYIYDAASAAKAEGTLATGAKKIYYPGDAGTILYVDDLPTDAPVIINDYAMVLNAAIIQNPTLLGAASYSAEIQVLLSDGTLAVWPVAIERAAKNLSATVLAGDYYFKMGKTYVNLDWTNATDNAVKDLIGGIYTHADKALVAAVPTTLASTASGAYTTPVGAGTIDTTSYTIGGAVVNNDTIFVMKNAYVPGTYVALKGLSALAGGDIITAVDVIAQKAYNAKTGTSTYVATVVFAEDHTWTTVGASSTEDVVFATGVYTTSYDAVYGTIYTYNVYDADGKATVAYGTGVEGMGVYVLDTDGYLTGVSAPNTAAGGIVEAVYGTTVKLTSGTYLTVNDSTDVNVVYYGTGLAKGASVYYYDVNNDQVVDVLYIWY